MPRHAAAMRRGPASVVPERHFSCARRSYQPVARYRCLMPPTAPLTELRAAYDQLVARGLKLDLTRGKPSPAQLDLAGPLLDLDLSNDHTAADGTDVRNYGGPDGLPELRAIFGELLHVPTDRILALGNSSLTVMHDLIVHLLLHGAPGVNAPWREEQVAFL